MLKKTCWCIFASRPVLSAAKVHHGTVCLALECLADASIGMAGATKSNLV